MKKILVLCVIAVLILSSCATIGHEEETIQDLPVVLTVNQQVYLADVLTVLREAKPGLVPKFVDAPGEDADDVEMIYYLAQIIQAYDSCLDDWIRYANSYETMLAKIDATLNGGE